MITLGITGRSGCGKSTVTAVFAAHGVPLVDADQISREILLPGSPLLPVLARRFGADILYADGSLNRRLADKQLKVELTPAAKTYVIDNGYDPLYGARPLRRFLQHTVETLVSRKLIADEVLPDTTLVVDCQGDQLVVR